MDREPGCLVASRRKWLRLVAHAALWLPLIPRPLLAGEEQKTSGTETLAVLLRDLFPHHGLGDDFYGDIARAVRARLDTAASARLDDGFRKLDQAAGGRWAAGAPAARRAQLVPLEKEAFFTDVYGPALELVYRDPRVWAVIGYGGNALAQGGYLTRGFDDIDWLPADAP